MENPLLDATGPGRPAFDRIRPEHAEPAVDAVLAANRERLQQIVDRIAAGAAPTWESLIEPLDVMSERLARAWGPVSHLFAVTSTAEWRAAHNACLPKVTAYGLELSQHEGLYRAYRALAERFGIDFDTTASDRRAEARVPLTARTKVIRDALRDFALSGVALPEEKRARFRAVAMRLSELQSKFQENVLDSAQAWSKHVTDPAALAGMTERGIAAAKAKAQAKGLEGYRLTLDFPSYDAVVSYADDRALRRELYEAYATRASDRSPSEPARYDNGPLMDEILALRQEQAALLGFHDYAEVSLATKMAESPGTVERFLQDLNARARPHARAELDELRTFARERDGLTEIQPWDVPYYAEKLKERKLGFSEDELRAYFQAPDVIQGMFSLVERLYDIRIERAIDVPAWHSDVTTYWVRDAAGATIGFFYLDPYARDDKRGGAWMDECLARRRTAAALQIPIAYLTCNFAPPLPGQPALMTHDEVLTLFHEFGHGLHHMLTRVDEPAVSGIRGVEWDAVELPSQFMENWCYDRPTLDRFARHWKTGKPLPDDLLDKLRASRSFHAAMATVRQLEFALFDLRLHRDYTELLAARASGGEARSLVMSVLDRARSEVSVIEHPSWNRMPNSFSHIFAGGYAAGYYSYKWAEVLSADAFAAFEEAAFAANVGRRFRDAILAQGGSRPAMELFVEFRGRKPELEPLLRQSGLA
jgi:oligopeptidase A